MSLFKKRKKDNLDERTDIERSFEETGQKVGKETGKFVQKSVDKINELKEKYDTDDKIDKVKELAARAEGKVDEIVERATQRGKEVINKVKSK